MLGCGDLGWVIECLAQSQEYLVYVVEGSDVGL